jgi:hypothetical protein
VKNEKVVGNDKAVQATATIIRSLRDLLKIEMRPAPPVFGEFA